MDSKIYKLKDILSELCNQINTEKWNVSDKWRCSICPLVESEVELLYKIEEGIPCFLNNQSADKLREFTGNISYLEFITNEKWCKFPSLKIAQRSSCGAPGTKFDDESHYSMVESWINVYENTEVDKEIALQLKNENMDNYLNNLTIANTDYFFDSSPLTLQYFHRFDSSKDPVMPLLGSLLQWPRFLSFNNYHITDTATCASSKGAITWWRIDDGGEFTLHYCLPPTDQQNQNFNINKNFHPENNIYQLFAGDTTPHSKTGRIPVKIIIFCTSKSYNWIIHDRETADSGKTVLLCPLYSFDQHLPPGGFLPILNVAILYADGNPLLIPPNTPYMSITLNHCCTVEQRRISDLFLDHVAYFQQKSQQWEQNQPVNYQYLRSTLKDAGHVQSFIVQPLIKLFHQCTTDFINLNIFTNLNDNTEFDKKNFGLFCIQRRLLSSLLALYRFSGHFSLTDNDRRKLGIQLAILNSHDADNLTLNESLLLFASSKDGKEIISNLDRYWTTELDWIEPGQIFCLNKFMYCAVIYNNKFMPIYGLPRFQISLAKQDYQTLTECLEINPTGTFTVDYQRNDLLEELF